MAVIALLAISLLIFTSLVEWATTNHGNSKAVFSDMVGSEYWGSLQQALARHGGAVKEPSLLSARSTKGTNQDKVAATEPLVCSSKSESVSNSLVS